MNDIENFNLGIDDISDEGIVMSKISFIRTAFNRRKKHRVQKNT